jgi:VanZ family protein
MRDINAKWNYTDYLKIFPALIFGIIIFYFSSLSNPYPTPPPGQIVIFLNPLIHICEFGLLTFLIFFGFSSKVKPFFLLTFSFFYAFMDEVHQYFVPYRYLDVVDLIVDSVGVILGFISYLLARKLYMRFKGKQENINN